jgi:glucokinase
VSDSGLVYAGVDLGGTNIKAALARSDGTVLAEAQEPTLSHAGPAAVLERIAALVIRLASEVGVHPQSLGLGCPGLVDVAQGVTRFFPNLPTQWRDVPAAEILQSRLSCPVRLLNDVRTATLGELTFGRGRGVSTMAFFALGTGVGGGVVIDGRLRLGPLGAAGELGHQTILPEGPLCGCGNRGCLETLVSGSAIVGEAVRLLRSGLAPELHKLVEGDIGRVTPREVALAAEQGDAALQDLLHRVAGYLGIGVANVVTVLHPELVVLGGGVAEMGGRLFEEVRRVVRRRVGMFPTDGVRIEPSELGEQAGVLGAIALAAQVNPQTG